MLLTWLKTVTVLLLGVILLACHALAAPDEPQKVEPAAKVTLLRVPDRGIQPQLAVDAKGIVHLIYFRGEPMHGDVFYVRSEDGARFSRLLRVNSQPGSVIATGTIRGA